MPVDRTKRDALADILAAYLRHEVDGAALHQRVREIEPNPQDGMDEEDDEGEAPVARDPNADWAVDLAVVTMCYQVKTGPLAYTRPEWEAWCRLLAFLKSDLELPQTNATLPDFDTATREIWVARAGVALILVGAGLSVVWGWWLFVAAWTVAGAAGLFAMNTWHGPTPKTGDEEAFFPFASAQDWQAHEPWLDSFDLPPCDPVRYRPRWSYALIAGMILAGVFVFGCLALFLAFGVLVTPLSQLFLAFTRDRDRNVDA